MVRVLRQLLYKPHEQNDTSVSPPTDQLAQLENEHLLTGEVQLASHLQNTKKLISVEFNVHI